MGLLKSVNGGGSFTEHRIPGTTAGCPLAVAVNPFDDDTIYAGGYCYPGGFQRGALFKTTNGGSTWTEITGQVLQGIVRQVCVDPLAPETVFARAGNTLYKSPDSGATWAATAPFDVTCFKLNPEVPGEIYASAPDDFHVSRDGGITWTSMGAGLEITAVSSIDLVPCVKMIYVGTDGGGVFRNRQEGLYMFSIDLGSATGLGGTTSPGPGIYGYAEGATVSVTAVPDDGYRFKEWTGGAAGTANPLPVEVSDDIGVIAHFQLLAPAGFTGSRKTVRSVFQVQYINVLTWQRTTGVPSLAAYRLYRTEGQTRILLDEVDAAVSYYWDRGVSKSGVYRYELAAVNVEGAEGEAAVATVGAAPDLTRALRGIRRR